MAEETAVRREAVPMSVLIVDDEQTVRDTCAAVAKQSGKLKQYNMEPAEP
jgi:hypothetical protein